MTETQTMADNITQATTGNRWIAQVADPERQRTRATTLSTMTAAELDALLTEHAEPQP